VLLWKCYSYATVPSRYYGNATNSLLCNRHCYVTMETPNIYSFFLKYIQTNRQTDTHTFAFIYKKIIIRGVSL
jgi:hypothetical protein